MNADHFAGNHGYFLHIVDICSFSVPAVGTVGIGGKGS